MFRVNQPERWTLKKLDDLCTTACFQLEWNSNVVGSSDTGLMKELFDQL